MIYEKLFQLSLKVRNKFIIKIFEWMLSKKFKFESSKSFLRTELKV